MNDFIEKRKQGKRYENYVQDYLERKFYMVFVYRKNNIKEYDMETIDGVKIEVKADSNALHSKRLFIQIYKDYERKDLGWIFTYSADIICFVILNGKLPEHLLFFDFKKIQAYVLEKYHTESDFNDTLVLKDSDKSANIYLYMDELEPFRLRQYDYHRN